MLADDEWQRRLTVDPNALVYGGLDAFGVHLAQESFHPSAAGHAELGRCVGEFLRGDAVQPRRAGWGRTGTCTRTASAPGGGRRLTGASEAPPDRTSGPFVGTCATSGPLVGFRARHRTTRSRGRVLSRSQPSSVTTTMSSIRAPQSPSRYTPGSTLNAIPGSSARVLPPTM